MAGFVAPALRALLTNLIDYAGMFPPAGLSAEAALANYSRYRESDCAWMLGRFVISAAELANVPESVNGPFAVLSDSDHPRAASIESKTIISLSKPVYCEVQRDMLEAVKKARSFAKIRTGGVTGKAIPEVEDVASYIVACAELRLPFKATAGLHHPIRSVQALTYAVDAPRATMHGFLNVFLAAAFAWRGERNIEPILQEMDSAAFRFDDNAHWRDRSLSTEEIADARRGFAHSFGSCSFEEPVEDLQKLGFL